MLLCCMGECSGQLVRSFLLAVKPQHACTSLFTGHLLYSCPVECVCESAVRCVVELYSQASFLLNAQLHLSYYIRTLLNPPMSWEALTNKATSSKEWIAMGVLAPHLCPSHAGLQCRSIMRSSTLLDMAVSNNCSSKSLISYMKQYHLQAISHVCVAWPPNIEK